MDARNPEITSRLVSTMRRTNPAQLEKDIGLHLLARVGQIVKLFGAHVWSKWEEGAMGQRNTAKSCA